MQPPLLALRPRGHALDRLARLLLPARPVGLGGAAEYLEEGDDQQHIPERFRSVNTGFATSDEQLEFRKYLCGVIYMFTFVEILCAILCAEEMGLHR